MNPNCGLCGVVFRTGDSTVMIGTKVRGAVHTACKARVDSGSNPVCDYVPVPTAEAVVRDVPTPRPARALPAVVPKFDSQLEAVYYQQLLAQKAIGEILRVDHHPEKLHLGGGRWYTPDFRLILPDSTVTFDEVKGGFAREAAMVRLDVAASVHPYRFRLVRLAKGSTTRAPRWDISVVDPH